VRKPIQQHPAGDGQEATVQQAGPGSESPLLRLVVFRLDGQRYGLELRATERVLPMVAVSPLPDCPEIVLGAINVHGEVVPIVDARRRLGLRAHDYGPAARLLLARTPRRLVALPVDDVIGVAEVSEETVLPPEPVLQGIGHISGIGALPDGLLLIHDLDTFLSIDEERQLADCLPERNTTEALE
jgi:purine-binding chemotaxis protein CheW